MPEKLYTYNFLWPGQDSRTSHFANWVRGKSWRKTRRLAKNKQFLNARGDCASHSSHSSRRCHCPVLKRTPLSPTVAPLAAF